MISFVLEVRVDLGLGAEVRRHRGADPRADLVAERELLGR